MIIGLHRCLSDSLVTFQIRTLIKVSLYRSSLYQLSNEATGCQGLATQIAKFV